MRGTLGPRWSQRRWGARLVACELVCHQPRAMGVPLTRGPLAPGKLVDPSGTPVAVNLHRRLGRRMGQSICPPPPSPTLLRVALRFALVMLWPHAPPLFPVGAGNPAELGQEGADSSAPSGEPTGGAVPLRRRPECGGESRAAGRPCSPIRLAGAKPSRSQHCLEPEWGSGKSRLVGGCSWRTSPPGHHSHHLGWERSAGIRRDC